MLYMPKATLIGRSSCLENQTNYIAALNEVIMFIMLTL